MTNDNNGGESFRSHFTTSASANEDKREERKERLGPNFHQRVRTVEGTRPPTNVRPAKDPWEEDRKKQSQQAPTLTPSQIRMTYKR